LFKPDVWKAKQRVLDQYGLAVTRRVIKIDHLGWLKCDEAPFCFVHKDSGEHLVVKPRYQVGEVVYIKEAWCRSCQDEFKDGSICYKNDLGAKWKGENTCVEGKWASPLFMPAWAARYFIQITDVRAERLQEITLQDIQAEGITLGAGGGLDWTIEARGDYQRLWDSINKEYPWSTNPWCWKYSFIKVNKPDA